RQLTLMTVALFLLACAPAAHIAGQPAQITVFGGGHDRQDSVVCFVLPPDARHFQELADDHGNFVPLQIDVEGHACFVERNLKNRAHKTYRLVVTKQQSRPGAGVQVSTQNCATASPLKLPQYLYGGPGFRGHRAWDGKEKTFFLTSAGESDRDKG